MHSFKRLTVLVIILVAVASTGLAQEVGKFAVVQNDVTSVKPGASQAVPAVVGAPIVINESEITGKASRAKFTFGEGAVISIGQNTTFEVSQQAVDQATGKTTSKVSVAQGKLRVFVSRFWGGRPEVEVNTPTAVVGIKGSDVLVEVFDGRTLITVFGGTADVRPKSGGSTSKLTIAQQASVNDEGVSDPVILDSPVLTSLWQLTEPIPDPPVDLPKSRPLRTIPEVLARSNFAATECLTCSGTTPIANPPVKATRDIPVTLGEPINSGTKAGRR